MDKNLEELGQFNYVGSIITHDGGHTKEIKAWISISKNYFVKEEKVEYWQTKNFIKKKNYRITISGA